MSVTVSDILKLPSMRGASVVAGKKGLSRILSSISVLEYANPDIVSDVLYKSQKFYGNEIVITGFLNNPEDIVTQCENLKKLAEAGEVGMIFYYVGIFMKDIDKKLIDIANDYDFVLICMPKNRIDLRYSDVITEVSEAIVKDRMANANFVGEIIETVSSLKKHQRTVETVLKLLRDRLKISLILTDSAKRILNEVNWPRSSERSYMPSVFAIENDEIYDYGYEYNKDAFVYKSNIKSVTSEDMTLFIFKEGERLSKEEFNQCIESLQLCVNIWSESHDEVVVSELVKAILMDEPLKMRRLAKIFKIDIENINTMWIIRYEGKNPYDIIDVCREMLNSYYNTVLIDNYEGFIVIFVDGKRSYYESFHIAEELRITLLRQNYYTLFTLCCELTDTASARNCFLENTNGIDYVAMIFNKQIFSADEVVFAINCQKTILEGEKAIRKKTSVLDSLEWSKDDKELKNTLTSYLLDGDLSVSKTAELLYVHKNTIKYRLKLINERLGYNVGKMPETIKLYEAVAIERIFKKVN